LGKPRLRWKDNINMGMKEMGCADVDWIEVAQGKVQWWSLVNMAM
jgi:hypothetical protein